MFVVQVKYNDNACAIFQVIITMILHKVSSEAETFIPDSDPTHYYSFNTKEDAQMWFEKWYTYRKIAYSKVALPISLPHKDAFEIIELQ